MANALIKYETIDSEQLKQIMDGDEPTPPKGWVDHSNDDTKGGSTQAGGESSDPSLSAV
jgi:cell division protease FtsH